MHAIDETKTRKEYGKSLVLILRKLQISAWDWRFLNWEWQDKNYSLESYLDDEVGKGKKATQEFNSYNPHTRSLSILS